MQDVAFAEQVGLVLRAHRRQRGLSQRAFAAAVGIPKSTVARSERSAAECSLGTIVALLGATEHSLGIVDRDGRQVALWESTDLRARDRSGRRFPAHREVRPVRRGDLAPVWWTLHEYLGTGDCGPQPEWTAEGFNASGGTRFGKVPRPFAPGQGARWPNGDAAPLS